MDSMLWMALVLLIGIVSAAAIRWLVRRRSVVPPGEALALLESQRDQLQADFFAAAAATGKPRGLRWKDCSFEKAVELARDRQSRQLVALIPVTIQFEAVEGGDMEGLPAVGNLRNASAVFYLEGGHWRTAGKAVFNLNPDEALRHFEQQYERVQP